MVTASAASRGFSTSHSRSPISVSSPAYSVALTTATWSKVDRVAAGAHHLLLGEAGIADQTPGKLAGQMLGAAGVERIGHQAGIVDARERDAVARERHHVELGVLHDLEDTRVL